MLWVVAIILIAIVFVLMASSKPKNEVTIQQLIDLNNEVGKDIKEAQALLEARAIEATSDLTEKALVCYQNGDDDNAIIYLEKCLKYDYPAWSAHFKLMDIYRERKDYKNELRVIKKSIDIIHADNKKNPDKAQYPIFPLLERLSEVEDLMPAVSITFSSESIEEKLSVLREKNRREGDIMSKVADLNNKGIALEKEGRINEAIEAYEENISLKNPARHSYERLMILYRRRKEYDNELRVINVALDVFMKENERRYHLALSENMDKKDELSDALEMNEDVVRDDQGMVLFAQYDVMKYINRKTKVESLISKQ